MPATPHSAPLFLKADDDVELVMHFNDSRGPSASFVPLTADARKLKPADFARRDGLEVQLGGTRYLRKDADHWISLTGDGLKAKIVPVTPRELALCLFVTPKHIGDLEPGRYKGTAVVVNGPEKEALAAVPVELSFRSSRWAGIGVVVLAVVLGLAVSVLSEAAAIQQQLHTGPRQALKRYASQLRLPVLLILAAVGGSVVFAQIYGSDPAWGSNGDDFMKLFAVCFIAQMSSNEGIDAVRRVAGKP